MIIPNSICDSSISCANRFARTAVNGPEGSAITAAAITTATTTTTTTTTMPVAATLHSSTAAAAATTTTTSRERDVMPLVLPEKQKRSRQRQGDHRHAKRNQLDLLATRDGERRRNSWAKRRRQLREQAWSVGWGDASGVTANSWLQTAAAQQRQRTKQRPRQRGTTAQWNNSPAAAVVGVDAAAALAVPAAG